MHFEYIASELITEIFLHCASISDVLALSSTCHRFRHIFSSSKKLPILEHAAEAQYGPLRDAVQLLTQNASQPAHLTRSVPFTFALLRQIVHVGSIAERWADIYPFKKWKYNFEDRRLLTDSERHRFRRALYRLWLYSRAFHTPSHRRETRMLTLIITERADLLHNFTTPELAEMADVHAVLRDVIHSNICPSNGTIARKFKKRQPDGESHNQLLFNIHLNYPPPPPAAPFLNSGFHNPSALANHYSPHGLHASSAAATSKYHTQRYTHTATHEVGAEGWGDDIPHYYVVEDMLKLDPEQILWLKECAPLRAQVEDFVRRLGGGRDWFDNNGETWGQTMEWVLRGRGEDVGEVLGAVAEGELGVAVVED